MNRRITADKYTRYETPRPYVQLSLELLGSVSMAALSLAASRVLFRLITEHLTNAGKENGKLAVSYRQLATYAGVHEKQIASALAELVDLGLVVVVQGRRPKGATKTPPNFYRLTFLPDHEGGWPSDEWRRFEFIRPQSMGRGAGASQGHCQGSPQAPHGRQAFPQRGGGGRGKRSGQAPTQTYRQGAD